MFLKESLYSFPQMFVGCKLGLRDALIPAGPNGRSSNISAVLTNPQYASEWLGFALALKSSS